MSALFFIGIIAILLGLLLLFIGGAGHSPVFFDLKEGSLVGEAGVLVLLIGFLIILIDHFL